MRVSTLEHSESKRNNSKYRLGKKRSNVCDLQTILRLKTTAKGQLVVT